MTESKYQKQLIREIERLFPGCIIIKNDPRLRQGMPDILILFNDKWAALELKLSIGSSVRPNQPYYIGILNDMSFASFIYPENEEAVLGALQSALRSPRETRIS